MQRKMDVLLTNVEINKQQLIHLTDPVNFVIKTIGGGGQVVRIRSCQKILLFHLKRCLMWTIWSNAFEKTALCRKIW